MAHSKQVDIGKQASQLRTLAARGRELPRPSSPPTPIPKSGAQLVRSSSRMTSASSGHLPLSSPPVSPVTPRGSSPSRSRTPRVSHCRVSPPTSPGRKRYSPPSALPLVPPDRHKGRRSVEGDIATEIEVRDLNNVRVPHIMAPPPRSPLRARPVRRADEPGPFTQPKASPPSRSSITGSTRTSVSGAFVADSYNARQSVASSAMTETTITTDISSLLDFGLRSRSNSSGQNKFGTIRTITTDITSAAPSMTRTEGTAIADELTRQNSTDSGGKHIMDRKASEGADLVRVVEEADDSGSSSQGKRRDEGEDRNAEQTTMNRPDKTTAVHLRKGKWPEDFIDAFQSHSRTPTPKSPPRGEGETKSSVSSPRKLAIVGASERNEGLEVSSQFPRRPTHRARQGLDSPGFLPKESPQSRDSSPGGLSSSPTGRVMLRRHSTKPSMANRNAIYLSPRNESEEPRNSAKDRLVPFPQTSSGDRCSPSPGGDLLGLPENPRIPRGRFRSDIDSSSARRRNRPNSADGVGPKLSRVRIESMMNLGADSRYASASDLLSSPRDSVDGTAVRRTLIIREDGKSPTHFQLGNCIGRGQFGSVYRALNLNTGQMVAVKRIRLEGLKEEEVTTLMREVDLVKSLSHPSIVKYEGMARDDDTLSLVLEYAENGSLGQTLKAFGKLNERLVASYVIKILEGLHYLHSSDVVHCDLKAANILTTKNGNVKLSDFGVSLNLRAMEREIKDVAGTPNWMAPEVIELKGASTKSDIWSLACTIIELLTGRPPYAEITNSMSVMFRIVEDAMPPIPEGCSPFLRDFLVQCFHKRPTMRPSAELLCEHPWLKKNWGVHKELRPQDSIPFLRRISTDLQKSEVAKYFPPDTDLPTPILTNDISSSPPRRRISEITTRFLADSDISPREHSFIKTTFSKPMVCRVCLLNVKRSAVLCEQCSLIAHVKCTVNAPPTCDLRAQLLLYAKYAEMGNLSSAYHNPFDGVRNGQPASPSSDVPYVAHTTSIDILPSPQPPSHPSAGHKFLGALAFKRSRTNLSQGSAQPVARSPSRARSKGGITPRKKTPSDTLRDRPRSLVSEGTDLSSLRSVATAAESFSSRDDASSVVSFTVTRQSHGEITSDQTATKDVGSLAPANTNEHSYGGEVPVFLSMKTGRPRKRDSKSPGCIMQ